MDTPRRTFTRRLVLQLAVVTSGALAVPGSVAGAARLPARPRGGDSGSGLPEVEGGEVVLDPAEFPAEFHERPEFAEMVEGGSLPPVAERIGEDPLVIRPVHETGSYGGTLRRAMLGVADVQNANRFNAGPDSLLYRDFLGETVLPNIARQFELSDDFTELVLHLRRGMRWSDGEPFTADDVVFWRDEISLNEELLESGHANLTVAGEAVVVERVDDHTVRYRSPGPNPLLVDLLAGGDISGLASAGEQGGGGYAPRHYLSQFHPSFIPQDEADAMAADAGFDSWVAWYRSLSNWQTNPDLPTLTPWIVRRPINDPPLELTANPYSIWVDTDGNQLPYIGEITMTSVEDRELIVLQATGGDLDFQDRHLNVANLPVLLENEQRGGYTVHRTPGELVDCGVRINLAYDADPQIGDLLRTVEFRRALALGVDRDQINEAFFIGTGIPTATMVSDRNPYFPGSDWRTKWATYDPEQANGLLDGLGLTDTDGDGYRLRPDGSGRIRLDYQALDSFADFTGVGDMLRSHWVDIGIDMTVETVQGNLIVERTVANQLMLSGFQVGAEDPFVNADTVLPTNTNNYPGMIGIPYALWFASGGAEGVEPPESLALLGDAMELLAEGRRAAPEDRATIGQEIFKLHADQVWSIGIVGFGMGQYGMYVAGNRLRNVPARIINSLLLGSPINALPMTFYYAD